MQAEKAWHSPFPEQGRDPPGCSGHLLAASEHTPDGGGAWKLRFALCLPFPRAPGRRWITTRLLHSHLLLHGQIRGQLHSRRKEWTGQVLLLWWQVALTVLFCFCLGGRRWVPNYLEEWYEWENFSILVQLLEKVRVSPTCMYCFGYQGIHPLLQNSSGLYRVKPICWPQVVVRKVFGAGHHARSPGHLLLPVTLLYGFQESVFKDKVRAGHPRICNELVYNSVIVR